MRQALEPGTGPDGGDSGHERLMVLPVMWLVPAGGNPGLVRTTVGLPPDGTQTVGSVPDFETGANWSRMEI